MVDEKSEKRPSQYGEGEPPDEKLVLEGMKLIESELEKENEELQNSFSKQLYMTEKLQGILKSSGIDFKTFFSDVRASATKARTSQVDTLSDIKFLKVAPFSFYGSIGATRIPPFDYQWSWESGRNSPDIFKSSNRTSGQMSFSMWEADSTWSSGSVRTAIGIYFRPPSRNGRNGHLIINASPAISASWGTWCAFASAHTDGWIGLYVGSYNASDNSFAGTAIDLKRSLFSDDSWFYGTQFQSLRNSGYPLSAIFPVDNAHWYVIWTWMGGRISAAGWGNPITGSAAHSGIGAAIPYMSWTYFG